MTEFEHILARLVRIGKVTDVDNDNLKCRVKFEDRDYTSGWLKVIKNQPFIPDYDVPQRTEYEAGGSGAAAYENHKHDLIIKPWMPKINEIVLCLYIPTLYSDGYVLGGL